MLSVYIYMLHSSEISIENHVDSQCHYLKATEKSLGRSDERDRRLVSARETLKRGNPYKRRAYVHHHFTIGHGKSWNRQHDASLCIVKHVGLSTDSRMCVSN
jgi:hypothetical protein